MTEAYYLQGKYRESRSGSCVAWPCVQRYFELFCCTEDLVIFRGTFVDKELVNSSEKGRRGGEGECLTPKNLIRLRTMRLQEGESRQLRQSIL